MTYRFLKKFISENSQPHNKNTFDLMPLDVKSKIVFIIGEDAQNTASFLTSIMNTCEISYLHYAENTDLNKRFIKNGVIINTDLICERAEAMIKAAKKQISNDDLFLSLALSFSDCEYTVIEMNEEYYFKIKDYIPHYALVLALRDDKMAQMLIDNAPSALKEIISLWSEDNFDYISTKKNKNGTRITLASQNKITLSNADLLGVSFYHYSYLYRIPILDLNNVKLAHLAIEAANVLFGVPRTYIYKGLENARPAHDLVLYSLSPAILLYNGKSNFKLHHKLKFKTVTENDEFYLPTENTVFCGSKEYLEKIKEKLKKR